MAATMSSGASKKTEFTFTIADFEQIRARVYELTGIVLSEAKKDMVYGRLIRRLRALGIAAFSDYLQRIDGGDAEEVTEFVNALTTNLTSFFRERHHFDYLRDDIAARWAAESGRRDIRIWSAGCSTGEEAYSIAISLGESVLDQQRHRIRLLATDVDTNVLQTARDGVYARDRLKGLSAQQLRRWFRAGTGVHGGLARAKDELRGMVVFKQLNLMEEWPFSKQFDVIFCRNVGIYFNKETQRRLFDRYANVLSDGGHLFIGHAESLHNVSRRFEPIGRTIYRKLH